MTIKQILKDYTDRFQEIRKIIKDTDLDDTNSIITSRVENNGYDGTKLFITEIFIPYTEEKDAIDSEILVNNLELVEEKISKSCQYGEWIGENIVDEVEGKTHQRITLSKKIDEEEYNKLIKLQNQSKDGDLKEAFANLGKKRNSAHNETSADVKTQNPVESQPKIGVSESHFDSETNSNFDDSMEVEEVVLEFPKGNPQPKKTQKTVLDCMRETARDRKVQKQSLGASVIAALSTGLLITVKAYHDTPEVEGESKIQKAKRVLRETLKRPSTYLTMTAMGMVAGGATYGYHTFKRMLQ